MKETHNKSCHQYILNAEEANQPHEFQGLEWWIFIHHGYDPQDLHEYWFLQSGETRITFNNSKHLNTRLLCETLLNTLGCEQDTERKFSWRVPEYLWCPLKMEGVYKKFEEFMEEGKRQSEEYKRKKKENK